MPPTVKYLSSANKQHVESTCQTFALTSEEFHALKRHSVAAKDTAYCPYSRFRVGAVILTKLGGFISGANVENASYPVGTCAERVAFGKAVTEGHRDFKALAVATDIAPAASPCGMCRQFIREFCAQDMPIIMFDKNGDYAILRLEDILPLSFGPDQLHPPPAPFAPVA